MKTQLGNGAIALIIVLFIIAIAVTNFKKKNPSISPSAVSTTLAPSPTLTPTVTPTPSGQSRRLEAEPLVGSPLGGAETDPKTGWKILKHRNWSIEYPAAWVGSASDFYSAPGRPFLEIHNKQDTVGIIVSPKAYPFGFEGQEDFKLVEKNEIEIEILGKMNKSEEIKMKGGGIFVNFKIDQPEQVYFLFGTGYPAHKNENPEDYQRDRNTILQILSTFQFIE